MASAQDLLKGLGDAARAAGTIILQATDIRQHSQFKAGHANYVTDYDRRVQDELFRRLGHLLPEAGFVGEENGADTITAKDLRGYTFCVDPIDGTSNFLAGYRPSVTSIALLKDGAPFIGIVYNPYQDLLFSAVKGEGAHENGKRILSSPEPLSRSLVSFGTAPYNPGFTPATMRICGYYMARSIDLRRSGSAAWDLAMMARGATGLFFEMELSLWDYAAGGLIAMEAGCRLTDISGRDLTWDGKSSVLCASRGVAGENYLPPKDIIA